MSQGSHRSSDASPSRPASPPLLLASGDFDAPGRTGFVRRALAWIVPLVERLAHDGCDVEAAPLQASEVDAIAVRPRGMGPRLALVLEIAASSVGVALEIPTGAPELEALRARLRGDTAASFVESAFEPLPESFAMALSGEPARPLFEVVRDGGAEAVEALVARAIDAGRRLRIGWQVPREIALAHAAILDEQLEAALAALAVPFVRILRDDPRGARAAGRVATRFPPSAKLFRAAPARGARAAISVGARVRVRSGPFEGRVGVVSELDARGAATVRLGLLAVRVEASELEGASAGPAARPALGSSHRRK